MTPVDAPSASHSQPDKWRLPVLLSIVHRGSGIFLSVSALLLSYWLLAIGAGPAVYARALLHIRAWYGELLLIACVFSIYYHLCNGIRLLFRDAGFGVAIKTANLPGYIVIVFTLFLTVATCALGMVSA